MKPLIKTGKPGEVVLKELDYIVSYAELEKIAYKIVQRGKFADQSFIEMDMFGATVIQLKNLRIVITRPPFSDIMEITAVWRPPHVSNGPRLPFQLRPASNQNKP